MIYRINKSWFGKTLLLFPLMILLGELIFLMLAFTPLLFPRQLLSAVTYEHTTFPIFHILNVAIGCALAAKFKFSIPNFTLLAVGWTGFGLAWLILAVFILRETPVDEKQPYIRRQNRIAGLVGTVGIVGQISKVIMENNFV